MKVQIVEEKRIPVVNKVDMNVFYADYILALDWNLGQMVFTFKFYFIYQVCLPKTASTFF